MMWIGGVWAPSRFPDLEVGVRGIQRFARGWKNAADMAIVADAVADFAAGLVNHVAVVSNDSDFGALFVKIQELANRADRGGAAALSVDQSPRRGWALQ